MGKLYVANCTKQDYEVQYHLHLVVDGGRLRSIDANPNQNRPAMRQMIKPGRQIPLGGDLSTVQVESVIRQLVPHGLVGREELYSPDHRNKKIPLVYSLDAPVSADVIRYVMDVNSGYMTEEGRQRRIQAAIATNATVIEAVNKTLAANQIDEDVKTTVDVEFEQVETSEFEETKIAQGIKVREDAPDAPPPKQPRPPRRRAA